MFVLLRHELPPEAGRASHWDLMLEDDDVLLTWELSEVPTAGATHLVRELPPHRLAYLDYEGPVSGNRGSVRRVDRGPLTWLRQSVDQRLCEIAGEELAGRLELERREREFWTLRLMCEG